MARVIIFLALVGVRLAWADQMEDLARIHKEAMGGSRLDECQAMEASGVVTVGGRELKFELVAARPNRVRLTLLAENRSMVQATDGVAPPWVSDSTKAPTVEEMKADDGRDFSANAEFDDPLTSPAARGYALDFAGEMPWRNRQMLKILVTRGDADPSFLLLDPDTYFIVARLTKRRLASGREVTVETCYDDFQPVEGVIIPHREEVFLDGALVRQTVMRSVRFTAEPSAEVFARPLLAAVPLVAP